MTITLPLPPSDLSPNRRPHWAVKAKCVSAYRSAAMLKGSEQARKLPTLPRWSCAVVQVTWYAKTWMHPDGDNALSMTKPIWDGLTDAGVFSDDRGLIHPPILFRVDRFNPRLEISIFPEPKERAA